MDETSTKNSPQDANNEQKSVKSNRFVGKGYIQLLIIECQMSLDWHEIFENEIIKTEGKDIRIQVEQAEWNDVSLVSYSDSGCVVSLRRSKSKKEQQTIQVDFVLLRSVTRGIHQQDSRNLLYGLIHANIPSVNTLSSIALVQERPIVFGALKEIQKKLGKKNFPLIEQTYYPNHSSIVVTPDFPLVAKVGHAHAGYGKIKIKSSEEMQDFKSLMALHGDYVTLEPFVQWDFDMRIQKIGNHYRGFKRTSPNWKGNTGNASVVEDMEVTPQYKLWIDECAKIFGGLDICALDLLHSKEDGKDYILELNDTAIGLVHKYEKEDMTFMRDIVLLRMKQQLLDDNEEVAADSEQNKDETISKLKEELEQCKLEIQRSQRKYSELEEQLKRKAEKKSSKFGLFK